VNFTIDLLFGVAEFIADAGIAVWRPDGPYVASDQVPIALRSVPAAPDRVLTLSSYGVDDEVELTDTTQGLQVRSRGTTDPRTVDGPPDAVFDVLHGLRGVDLNGVHLVLARRVSWTPLGADQNGRHERSDNYHLRVIRPSAHRFD